MITFLLNMFKERCMIENKIVGEGRRKSCPLTNQHQSKASTSLSTTKLTGLGDKY